MNEYDELLEAFERGGESPQLTQEQREHLSFAVSRDLDMLDNLDLHEHDNYKGL